MGFNSGFKGLIWFKNWRWWCHHYGEGREKQHESDLRSYTKYNRKCSTLMSTETERFAIRHTAIWLNTTYIKTCVHKIQFQNINVITQHSKQLRAKFIKFTNCIFNTSVLQINYAHYCPLTLPQWRINHSNYAAQCSHS